MLMNCCCYGVTLKCSVISVIWRPLQVKDATETMWHLRQKKRDINKGRRGFRWESEMSLPEWPWRMQRGLNWLQKSLSYPMSLPVRNPKLAFPLAPLCSSALPLSAAGRGTPQPLERVSHKKTDLCPREQKWKELISICLLHPIRTGVSLIFIMHIFCWQWCGRQQKEDGAALQHEGGFGSPLSNVALVRQIRHHTVPIKLFFFFLIYLFPRVWFGQLDHSGFHISCQLFSGVLCYQLSCDESWKTKSLLKETEK